MKTSIRFVFTFFVCSLLFQDAFSQFIPQGLNYQAIVRDSDGKEIASKAVGVQFVIYKGDTVTKVYAEALKPTTNSFGLVNVVIGKGKASIGKFATIDWLSAQHYIGIFIDPTGSTKYQQVGSIVPFQSVPYALGAQAANGVNGVNFTAANDQDVLQYDAKNQLWRPGTLSYLPGAGLRLIGKTFSFADTVGSWNKNGAYIYTNNNVGIGTASPAAKLHLYQGSGTGSTEMMRITAGGTSIGDGPSLVFQSAFGGATPGSYPNWKCAEIFSCYKGFYASDLVFSTNPGGGDPVTEKMRIMAGGSVGIGIAAPTEKLHVVGNGLFTGKVTATSFPTSSDLRYKKNISLLNNSLSNVLKLRGVSYNFRKDEFPEKEFSSDNQIGFIAQELEKIYPEFVFTDAKGFKSVDYSKLTPVLVEAIKEQQKLIDTQSQSIESLKAKLEDVKTGQKNSDQEFENLKTLVEGIQHRLNITAGK